MNLFEKIIDLLSFLTLVAYIVEKREVIKRKWSIWKYPIAESLIYLGLATPTIVFPLVVSNNLALSVPFFLGYAPPAVLVFLYIKFKLGTRKFLRKKYGN